MISNENSQPDSCYLGWNPLDIQIGRSLFDLRKSEFLDLDLRIGGIRNCSYASGRGLVGISAEDRSHGGQVVAIYEPQRLVTHVLVRQEYVLHHALNKAGTKVSYTQPSVKRQAADLYIFDFEEEDRPRLVAGSAVAQDSTPVWFPDDTHIAYQSAEGRIEILDSVEGHREVLEFGKAPCVDPDGETIAFHREGDIFIWSQREGMKRRVPLRRWRPSVGLVNGLSWAPNGKYLSFGVVAGPVGKQTRFYLLDVANGKCWKTTVRYLSGLLLLEQEHLPIQG